MSHPRKIHSAHHASRRAFTLVELLVVIAIIGLLSTVAVVATNTARAKARDVKRLADMRQMQTALELYINANGQYPDGDNDGLGQWDIGNASYPFLNGKLTGIMNNPPRDRMVTGNYTGYMYYHYTAGDYGCPASKGAFYVLGVKDMETSSGVYPGSPGWKCSGWDWSSEMEWVTGRYEKE
jgi:prepilin-type N-terminal cleavage/methylation domain-containing protein